MRRHLKKSDLGQNEFVVIIRNVHIVDMQEIFQIQVNALRVGRRFKIRLPKEDN